MAYALGVFLFAFGIIVSVCLHEAGHMWSAKAFGMKVTRYFVGFGPTLWSFRRGETEYGLKAIPAGGFVKIVGMSPLEDDVTDGDQPRAFWRKPLWQRTVVLTAGSATHFVLGFALLWVAAAFVGVPNPAPQPAVIGEVSDCVVVKYEPAAPGTQRDCRPDDPVGPAKKAGLRPGDEITSVNGTPTRTYDEAVAVIRQTPPGQATLTIVRDNSARTIEVDLVAAERLAGTDPNSPELTTVSVLGVALGQTLPITVTYGPVEAVGVAVDLTGTTFTGIGQSLLKFPEKVPKLFTAITGGERDPETPISVVGASRIGGEAVQAGIWPIFVLSLAVLNLFIGVFNLLPLLPLDGGHIAVAWFEKARSWLAARRGRPDPGRVDYAKLMPVTYVVILIFAGITLLTVTADIVNPITLFSR